MSVVTQSPSSLDFNHDSSCSTPYISAPSSPKLTSHELYFSAPTSPTRFSSIYQEFNNNKTHIINNGSSSSSVIPFGWEEKPGKPKFSNDVEDEKEDFAFDFSGQFEKPTPLSAADELFDGGKIRPLKPPPRLQLGIGFEDDFSGKKSLVSSPRSPRSPISQGKKIIREAFSPRQRNNKDVDPFAVAIEESRKETEEEERGRDKRVSNAPKTRHSWTRSLSPFRVSEFDKQQSKPNSSNSKWSFGGYKKWKLKDFLLFRSASEGRATEKETLRKYSVLSKKNEDVKSSSFRSTDSTGSASSSRRRGPVSPHELHYTVNRAVSEELKKKTFLPYKQGLLGCLGFNPTANGLTKGFNL